MDRIGLIYKILLRIFSRSHSLGLPALCYLSISKGCYLRFSQCLRVEGDEHHSSVTWITRGVVQVLWSPWSLWGWLALQNLRLGLDFQAPPIRQKIPVLGG